MPAYGLIPDSTLFYLARKVGRKGRPARKPQPYRGGGEVRYDLRKSFFSNLGESLREGYREGAGL